MNRREMFAALAALPAVRSIEIATAKADDVIVVECDGWLSIQGKETLRAQLQSVWPGRKIVIFDGGMRFKIARSETT